MLCFFPLSETSWWKILSYKLVWEYRRSLIHMHTAGESQPVKHTQSLGPFSRLLGISWTPMSPERYPQHDLLPLLNHLMDGALIFKTSERVLVIF